MPTAPLPELLPRSTEPEIQAFLNKLADNLDEIVNFGTRIFQWQNEACAGRRDEVAPVALLFRHMLGMLDGVSILIRDASIEPSHACLRSVLEASVQLHWLLQDKPEKRGMAFMVWDVHQRLKQSRKFDRQTQEGKQLATQLKGTIYDNIDAPSALDLQEYREGLEAVLKKDHYQEAANEYKRLRSEGERNPKWYRFYNGPRDLEQLSNAVNMQAWYQILYRHWSSIVHATDVIAGKLSINQGQGEILQLRYPVGVESVYSFSTALALKTYCLLMKEYDPPKLNEIRSWYIAEVRQIYNEVSSRSILISEGT